MSRHKRFDTQLQILLSALRADRKRWWTLRDLSRVTNICETSLSAQLRNLRKPVNGEFTVDKRRLNTGEFEYRLGME